MLPRTLTGRLAAAGRFTFLLLLVAVGALITPPNNTIRFHDEAAAVKAIQTIQTMQVQYNSQYGRFATSLTELGPPVKGAANASSADLIDSALAAGERAVTNSPWPGSKWLRDQCRTNRLRQHRRSDILFRPDDGHQ